MDREKIQRIKFIIAMIIVSIVIIVLIVASIIYNKTGEKNMPFNLSKIIVVSSASFEEVVNDENNQSIWNYNIIQNNDVYVAIEKNENYKKKFLNIKNVSIDSIKILEGPKCGSLKAYMPNSAEGNRFVFSDNYLIQNSLTYRGAENNDYKNLLVSNNGGNIAFSLANKDLGIYKSTNDDSEIVFNGTALSKIGKTNEDVKSKVSFNIIIELEDGKKYLGNIVVDINCDNLIEQGTITTEISDFSNVIFKRI